MLAFAFEYENGGIIGLLLERLYKYVSVPFANDYHIHIVEHQ